MGFDVCARTAVAQKSKASTAPNKLGLNFEHFTRTPGRSSSLVESLQSSGTLGILASGVLGVERAQRCTATVVWGTFAPDDVGFSEIRITVRSRYRWSRNHLLTGPRGIILFWRISRRGL